MAAHRGGEPIGGKNRSRHKAGQRNSQKRSAAQAESASPSPAPTASAFQAIADGLITLDPDQRCTYVNEAAAAFLKTSPAEALGRVIWETRPALQDSRLREGLTRATKKKIFVKLEEYCESPGRWLEFRCHPTQDGLVVLINDVTSHKKIEEVMLESRQALEMAITGSSAGIWRIDLNPEKPGEMPDYAYLSPRLKALLGFDSGEFPNSRSAWQDRIPPEDMPRVQEATRAHLEGRTEIYEVDYRIRHKDGSLRWFNSRGKLFRDEFDRPIRWAGVDMDITEQKLAAEVLRDREERLRGALEAGRVFTFEWHPSTDEVLRSANSASILGWPGDATHDTGEAFFARINSEDRETFVRLVSTLSPERAAYRTTYRYVRPNDGREVVLEESGCAIFDESGTMVCLRGLTRDITERTRAEESLHRARELSQSLNRINEMLHSTLDIDEVAQRLLAEGVAALGSDSAAVSLRRSGGWIVSHVHGMPADLVGTRMEDDEERHAVLAIESRRAVAVADALSDKRVNRRHLRTYKIRAVLTAPLITRGEPVGVIFFNYRDAPRAFTEAETDFAQQLATTATIAMENARLFDEHKRAEQALREAHKQAEWLARFPQENPNPVLRISADGRVLYRNPAAMELPAWGCEVGRPLPESLQPLVARALAEKKQVHQDVQLDGTFYAVYVAPVPSEGYANIYGRDITDLWQAHERQEMAQRAAGAGIWDWNVATQSMEWSPEMFDLFGIDSRTAGASFAAWEAVLHPDDREIAASMIHQALAEHTELNSEYRIVRPDGQVRWINARGRGAYDSSGRPVRMMGICIDITERRQAEETIRKAREELEDRVRERTKELKKANEALQQAGAYNRSLIEASLDPLVTIGPDGRITDVNRATEEVTGRSRTELIGTDFSDYFTEPEQASEGYRTVFRDGSVRDYPLEIRHASGRVTPVLYNATVYRNEAGEAIGVFAAARDVAALRRAEQARAHLAAIVESSDDAIIGKDLNGTITSWNKGAERLYGYAAREVVGKSISLLTPQENLDEIRQILDRVRQNESIAHFETIRVTKDNRPVHVSLMVSPIRDECGQVVGVSTVARDVTEQRKTREAMEAERRRFNDVLDMLPAYVVLLAPDYHVPFANRFFRERFGDSGGKRCFEYLFDRTEPCENCESYVPMKTNAPYRWEWTGPDGRIYDIHDFPFADIDGSTLVLEMGIDITEQRRAEKELREHHDHLEKLVDERTKNLQEANERLRTQAQDLQASNAALCQREQALVRAKEHWERTFHSVPDLIAILDDQHHIVQANRAMAERLGMTPEQCIGLPCYRTVHCANVPPAFCPHAQTLRDGREHAVETHEDRLEGDFLVSTTPLHDENGQMIGSVHVARDITERKRAEEEVRRRMEELRIANEELTRFNRAMVNRELRMVELKKEINELCLQVGLAARYRPDPEQKEKP